MEVILSEAKLQLIISLLEWVLSLSVLIYADLDALHVDDTHPAQTMEADSISEWISN